MSRLPRYYDRDLILAGSLAVAGVLVAVLPLPDWMRTTVLLPLALIVPGYALGAAIFPPRYITSGERVPLTAAFSIGVWALGGLLVQSAFGLDRGLWLALFLAVTLVSCAIAQSRREVAPVDLQQPRPDPLRPGSAAIVAGILAVAVCATAIAVASGGAERQLNRSHFSALWVTTSNAGPARPGGGATVGVLNHEDRSIVYRLRVSQSGRTISELRFRLAGGLERKFAVAVPENGDGALVAALFRDGVPYRRIALEVSSP